MGAFVRFCRRYMLPHWPSWLGGTVALAATSWLSVSVPMEVARGVDAIARHADPGIIQQSALRTAAMGLAIILIRTLSRVLYFTPGRHVEAAIKRDLYSAILRHQPSTLRTYTTGDLFSRLSNDVNMIRVGAGFGTLTIANVVVSIIFAGGQMARTAPSLAAWLLLPVGLAFLIVQLLIRRLFVLIKRMQAEAGAISEELLQTIQAMPTIQGFAVEDVFQRRFDDRNLAYQATNVERAQIRAALAPTLTLSASVSLFFLLWIGGPMAARGEMTVGELVAFAALVNLIMSPLRQSSFLVSVVQQARAGLERIDLLLYAEPDRPDLPNPVAVPDRAPHIRVEHLTWSYPGADKPALHDINLDLPAGATIGLFGATGSGKSTLLRLLARLDNPPPDTILVDGVDVRRLDLDGWRRLTATVSQRPFLFSEPLRENLTLGAPDRLEQALTLGSLRTDLLRMPDGPDTLVGESGVRLSGGQRQRTALARALVRPHHVALLDDVLSAVDHATEREILGHLRAKGTAATTVMVAHRPSALNHCDRVYVLEGGRVVDQGTPAELLERPGAFQEAWHATTRQDDGRVEEPEAS
jgi:ATP-binding cassette subfamily B multidrug efflux pump